MPAGRRTSSQTSHTSRGKISRTKLVAILVVIIVASSTIALFALNPTIFLQQKSSGDLPLGLSNCNVGMTTTPLDKNGNPIQLDNSSNSPWYVNGHEVSSLQADITINTAGDNVDWSTLDILLILTANDNELVRWHLPETVLDPTAGGYAIIKSYEITDFDALVDFAHPEQTLDDGSKIYSLELKITATGTVEDAKGNELTDTVAVRQVWDLATAPDGAFSMNADDAHKPVFTSAPPDASITQGTNHLLRWGVSDDNPAAYVIKTYTPADGSQIVRQGTWNNTDTIEYDIGGFVSIEPGDVDVTVSLTIIDQDGQQAVDSVKVHITVPETPAAPTFSKSDGPITSSKSGPVELFITFKPSSPRPQSYKIYANGVLKKSGTWDGGNIAYAVTYLYAGVNSFKCVVYDTLDQSKGYTHAITAPTSTLPPQTSDPEDPSNFVNAPWSLGYVSQISIGLSACFVTIGVLVYFINRRRR
ncbi:MAG: hypothetical protein ACTSX2_06315 [Candidatus Thorarchaeota archaeon]